MAERPDSDALCPRCGQEVNSEDDFCVHCGEVFAEKLPCQRHPDRMAEGVCVICTRSCCPECGSLLETVYLCQDHTTTVKVFDRGATVFLSDDLRLVQIAGEALQGANFHPFVVPRATAPVTNLGRLTPNPTVGAHLVIVPFREFLSAQEFLQKSGISR
jgi:hypothetical protein